jgi:hypothetical protein
VTVYGQAQPNGGRRFVGTVSEANFVTYSPDMSAYNNKQSWDYRSLHLITHKLTGWEYSASAGRKVARKNRDLLQAVLLGRGAARRCAPFHIY